MPHIPNRLYFTIIFSKLEYICPNQLQVTIVGSYDLSRFLDRPIIPLIISLSSCDDPRINYGTPLQIVHLFIIIEKKIQLRFKPIVVRTIFPIVFSLNPEIIYRIFNSSVSFYLSLFFTTDSLLHFPINVSHSYTLHYTISGAQISLQPRDTLILITIYLVIF